MTRLSLPAWLGEFLSRYKRSVAVALVLGLVASGCAALLMFTSGYLISGTAQPGITLFAIMIPVAFVQLFGFGRPFARYLERLVSHDWVLKITSDLRLSLYRAIEARIGDPARERAAAEYLSILADDIAHLQNLYLRVVLPTAIALLLALCAAIAFGCFSIPFALVMLLVFALTAVLLPLASLLATRALSFYVRKQRTSHFEGLTDDVMGSLDWVLANRGADAIERNASADDDIRDVEMRIQLTVRSLSLASTLLLGGSVCLVMAWSAGAFGSDPSSANWIAAFVLGFFPIIESLSVLPAALAQSPNHTDAIERLDTYIGDGPASTARTTIQPLDVTSDCNALELDHVTYAYPGNAPAPANAQSERPNPVVCDVSLVIPAGQTLVLLGRSGAGKSTLAQLIRGVIRPDSGYVHAFGQPTSDGAGALVGYLGQTPYLFNRTLRENLTLGVLEANDEKLEHVLEAVGLKHKLDRLEQGLDTVIGETGIGLSGGEAHRVALARLFVADTPIVLVDEPFSALDPETERDLLRALLNLCASKTLIVITHHLANVEQFDRVVLFENGMIELDGSPESLASESPRFRELVELDKDYRAGEPNR